MHSILILGASYGSLFATKLLAAGHAVELVCPPAVADVVNRLGTRVIMPLKGRSEPVEVDSRSLPGRLSASRPDDVEPQRHQLIVLAMQEPQFRAPELRRLLARVAAARLPCLSLMNMPPLPYLARIPGFDTGSIRTCYADATVWDVLDPERITLCSADAQASRVPDRAENVVRVNLPTNFRAARFESAADTALLRQLAADIDAARFDSPDGPLTLPVRLRVHDSVFVPLSKWPMLVTGNYRCITQNGARSIRDAVYADPGALRETYEWVLDLCRGLGASHGDLVPFDAYAAAASSLVLPSSAARALAGGATHIERVDRLVQAIAMARGLDLAALDELVALVDDRLAANRRTAGLPA